MIIAIGGKRGSGKDTVARLLTEQLAVPALARVFKFATPIKATVREVYGWTHEHTDGELKDVPDERYPREHGDHFAAGSLTDPGPFTCIRCGEQFGGSGPEWEHDARLVSEHFETKTVSCPGPCISYLTPREAMKLVGDAFLASYPDTLIDKLVCDAEAWERAVHDYDDDDRCQLCSHSWRVPTQTACVERVALVTDCRYAREAKVLRERGHVVIYVHRPSLDNQVDTHPTETEMQGPEYQQYVQHRVVNDGTLDDLAAKVARVMGRLGLETA